MKEKAVSEVDGLSENSTYVPIVDDDEITRRPVPRADPELALFLPRLTVAWHRRWHAASHHFSPELFSLDSSRHALGAQDHETASSKLAIIRPFSERGNTASSSNEEENFYHKIYMQLMLSDNVKKRKRALTAESHESEPTHTPSSWKDLWCSALSLSFLRYHHFSIPERGQLHSIRSENAECKTNSEVALRRTRQWERLVAYKHQRSTATCVQATLWKDRRLETDDLTLQTAPLYHPKTADIKEKIPGQEKRLHGVLYPEDITRMESFAFRSRVVFLWELAEALEAGQHSCLPMSSPEVSATGPISETIPLSEKKHSSTTLSSIASLERIFTYHSLPAEIRHALVGILRYRLIIEVCVLRLHLHSPRCPFLWRTLAQMLFSLSETMKEHSLNTGKEEETDVPSGVCLLQMLAQYIHRSILPYLALKDKYVESIRLPSEGTLRDFLHTHSPETAGDEKGLSSHCGASKDFGEPSRRYEFARQRVQRLLQSFPHGALARPLISVLASLPNDKSELGKHEREEASVLHHTADEYVNGEVEHGEYQKKSVAKLLTINILHCIRYNESGNISQFFLANGIPEWPDTASLNEMKKLVLQDKETLKNQLFLLRNDNDQRKGIKALDGGPNSSASSNYPLSGMGEQMASWKEYSSEVFSSSQCRDNLLEAFIFHYFLSCPQFAFDGR